MGKGQNSSTDYLVYTDMFNPFSLRKFIQDIYNTYFLHHNYNMSFPQDLQHRQFLYQLIV